MLTKPEDLRKADDFWAIKWLKLHGYLRSCKLKNLESAALDIRPGVRQMQRLYGEDLAGPEDGWLAGKTLNGMLLDRCSVPDEFDEELASADPEKIAALMGSENAEDGLAIKQLHESMVVNSNWGACRDNIRVHIDDSRAPSWWSREKYFSWIQARFREVGGNFVETENSDSSENEIRVSWRNGRSWIGLAQFGSCSQSVFCYFDPGFNGGETQNKNLGLHEHCHNMGVGHSRGIMAPVIRSVEPYWVKRDQSGRITYQDPSYPQLKRILGGDPIDGPGPEPEPEPGPSDLTLPLEGHWTQEQGINGIVKMSDGRVAIIRTEGNKVLGEII